MKDKRKINFANVMTLCAFAFFLFMMIYNLMHSAPWGDEWVEYYYSKAGIRNGDLYQKIISTYQPPLYNFLMHFWLKISDNIIWFRFFNVITGTIAGIFVYKGISSLYSSECASITLTVLGTCYQWIYCIQECSEYALMLMFLCGTLYFYIQVEKQYSRKSFVLFLLMAVGAVYSQYGSVFIIAPLLIIFYVHTIIEKNRKHIQTATVYYILCAVFFALPLYLLFFSMQSQGNEITAHVNSISLSEFMDFFHTLGSIIGYYFHSPESNYSIALETALCIVILSGCIYIIAFKKTSRIKRGLSITLISAYIFHFLLVKLHIYAMTHPDQSAGFYVRYSYFYIPLLCIVMPMLCMELKGCISRTWSKYLYRAAWVVAVMCFVYSFTATLENWNKSYDDEYAQLWIQEKAYDDTTIFVGTAKYAYDYYIHRSPDYNKTFNEKVYAWKDINLNNLPDRFWIWKSGWGQTKYEKLIQAAAEQGYTITIIKDDGNLGTLTFCKK